MRTLKELEEGTVKPEAQGDSPTEYARMLDKSLGEIDWNQDAVISLGKIWPKAITTITSA